MNEGGTRSLSAALDPLTSGNVRIVDHALLDVINLRSSSTDALGPPWGPGPDQLIAHDVHRRSLCDARNEGHGFGFGTSLVGRVRDDALSFNDALLRS
jgi:hypothetical protein